MLEGRFCLQLLRFCSIPRYGLGTKFSKREQSLLNAIMFRITGIDKGIAGACSWHDCSCSTLCCNGNVRTALIAYRGCSYGNRARNSNRATAGCRYTTAGMPALIGLSIADHLIVEQFWER